MNARARILESARDALGPSIAVPTVPRNYRAAGSSTLESDELLHLFCERVSDYGAAVYRTTTGELERAVFRIATDAGAGRLAVPPALAMTLDGVEPVLDEPPASVHALEQLDGALTGSALAIAETGTIVLDAIARLADEGRNTRPLTFVPGPSATVDIGFERVEGVRGPSRLHVVIVQ